MAHRAGHPGPRELHAHRLLGLGVSVEEQIAYPDLLQEHFLEHFELLGGVLFLMGRRLRGDQEEHSERAARGDPIFSGQFHGYFSVVRARLASAVLGGVSASASRGCRTWLRLSPHPESAVAVA